MMLDTGCKGGLCRVPLSVTPVKTGVQGNEVTLNILDSGLRRNDDRRLDFGWSYFSREPSFTPPIRIRGGRRGYVLVGLILHNSPDPLLS
jgi:hypothetical protein